MSFFDRYFSYMRKNTPESAALVSKFARDIETADFRDRPLLIRSLGSTWDTRAAEVLEKYLDFDIDSWPDIRAMAAFELTKVYTKKSGFELGLRMDTAYRQRDENFRQFQFWRVAAFSLGVNGQPNAILPLIHLLRERFYEQRSVYAAYAANRGAYMPPNAETCHSMTIGGGLSAFVLEDILIEYGDNARSCLVDALNTGGMNNHQLCYPLERLGWSPTNATEKFFWTFAHRNAMNVEESIRAMEAEYRTQLQQVSMKTLSRSLVGYAGWDPRLGKR